MCDKECRNGHIMAMSQHYCPTCGETAHRLNGLTSSEHRRREKSEEDE